MYNITTGMERIYIYICFWTLNLRFFAINSPTCKCFSKPINLEKNAAW